MKYVTCTTTVQSSLLQHQDISVTALCIGLSAVMGVQNIGNHIIFLNMMSTSFDVCLFHVGHSALFVGINCRSSLSATGFKDAIDFPCFK